MNLLPYISYSLEPLSIISINPFPFYQSAYLLINPDHCISIAILLYKSHPFLTIIILFSNAHTSVPMPTIVYQFLFLVINPDHIDHTPVICPLP